MKKRILVVVICLCLLCAAVISAAGGVSDSNTLISHNYLYNTYLPDLKAQVAQRVSAAWGDVFGQSSEKLDTLGQYHLDRLSPYTNDNWLVAESFESWEGEMSDAITLATGSGLIWSSGEARASGNLIDLTTGAAADGSALVAGHRYMAAGECVITLTTSAQWQVEGRWSAAAAE